MINNKSEYTIEAVQAAVWVLEERSNISEDEMRNIQISQQKIDNQEARKEQLMYNSLGIPVGTTNSGTRFLHSIIDGFVINMLFYTLDFFSWMDFNVLYSFIIFPIYYIFFEYEFQQTPGKMVTNTVVVDKNGNAPDFKSIVIRTLARYVPFEAFSCFGEYSWGWHDKWAETYVIDKKNEQLLQEKSSLEEDEEEEDIY